MIDDSKILVVDDSLIGRRLVEATLSLREYPVILADSGQQAIKLFAKHKPAVVITDWMMPDLNGIELCQRIRLNPQHAYTYIIMLTANSETENIVKGLNAGADEYLTKPFNHEELLARVAVGVRITALHRQILDKNRQLQQLATTDELTGLPNRRAIADWAATQLSAATRHQFPLWVAIADLDHLKHVNDTYGHEAGDAVLKRFAEILKTNLRNSNICGRIGGDEFLMVLTHVDQAGARTAIERICAELQTQRFNFGGEGVTVAASFGIAGFNPQQGQDFDRLVAQADVALYSAKRQGRNQVEVAVSDVRAVLKF